MLKTVEDVLRTCKMDCNGEHMTFCDGDFIVNFRIPFLFVREWLIVGVGNYQFYCDTVSVTKNLEVDIQDIADKILDRLNE